MLGGGNHKKGGTKSEWGKQKGKNMIFYLNLAGRKTLVETMIFTSADIIFHKFLELYSELLEKIFLSQIFTFLTL